MPVEPPPNAKTAPAMMAAMPAIIRPDSTAEAPVSERPRKRRPESWPRQKRDQNSRMFTISVRVRDSAAALDRRRPGDLGAGVGDDARQAAAEGEDDDDDQGGDAGDQ